MMWKGYGHACTTGLIILLAVMCSATAARPAAHKGVGVQDAKSDLTYAWGKPVSGYQMGIAVAKTTFAGGNPVLVHVEVKNLTNEMLILPSQLLAEKDFTLVVTDHSGKAMSLTRFGRSLTVAGIGTRIIGGVRPHAVRSVTLDASRIYDMTVPGEYSITVRRHVTISYKPYVGADFSSGTIKVRVLSSAMSGACAVHPGGSQVHQVGRSDVMYAWGKPISGCQMGLFISKTMLAGSDPVVLDVRVRNLTDKTLLLPTREAPENDFSLIVADQAGKAMPLTRFGALVAATENAIAVMTPLLPHSEHDFVLDASRVYDMTLWGDYSITVRGHVTISDKPYVGADLSSGIIKVTVLW